MLIVPVYSGAAGGCQAEVSSATAMAARMIVECKGRDTSARYSCNSHDIGNSS
ncbi:L-serine ammonia-lyase, iron-sulfur-dependent, subunit alpha [Bacillus wudalianchiensis]|uniref:L-serine ammonia-lyase, iron-sulfur-dependent, subunit alpha n=1 Tax=Pseudobacillus wudalianchiensis TaxID=1743143 RepID=UPI001146B4DA